VHADGDGRQDHNADEQPQQQLHDDPPRRMMPQTTSGELCRLAIEGKRYGSC
jgi:hypothetical protein